MVDLQYVVLTAISYPAEAILHSNYTLCFWGIVAIAALFVSKLGTLLVLLGALFALLASYKRREWTLPRCRGPLDVLLGRKHLVNPRTPDMVANNNVSIVSFADRFVLAYRNADSHFASAHARLIVVSSAADDLEEWTKVWEHATGEDDLREMLLFTLGDRLFLYYVRLAPEKRGFTPRFVEWTATKDLLTWSKPTKVGRASEIVWDVKVRAEDGGRQVAYKVSYVGNHYAGGAVCTVLFEKSTDGMTWSAVGEDLAVYTGGVCEVSFDFTPAGDLIAIGRNEDGDATGFGSQLFFARKGNLGKWTPLPVSLPHRFDSPRMLCVEGEMILFARYACESYCFVPRWLPFPLQQMGNLVAYSTLPKSAAVYRVSPPDQDGAYPPSPIELVRCFEDTYGDTGFFSVARDETAGAGGYVVANYSSWCHSHAPWIYGQVFATDVYVCRCQIARPRSGARRG